jgi:transposase
MVVEASRQIQLMQKALTECNLKLHHVFSDLDGESCLRIIEAILAGERDPLRLAAMRDHRCRTPLPKILKALEGDYRPEYLFVLGQCLNRWRQIRAALAECDQQVEQILSRISTPVAAPEPGVLASHRRPQKNSISWDAFAEGWRFYGVDLAAVPGISSSTLAVLMSELGTGTQIKEAFPSAKHFCSWLGVCPENRISGGRVLTAKTRKNACRVAAALRMGAQTLGNSKSALGDLCRRLKGRLGKAEGITAMAHKLGRILYSMIITRQPYDETKALALTPAKRQRRLRRLLTEAKRLGFALTPTEMPA